MIWMQKQRSLPGHSDSDVEDAVVIEETTGTKTEPESVEDTNEAASTAEEPGSENKEPEQASTEKKSRSWIGALAFVLALCALIVAGYGFSKLQDFNYRQLLWNPRQPASLNR